MSISTDSITMLGIRYDFNNEDDFDEVFEKLDEALVKLQDNNPEFNWFVSHWDEEEVRYFIGWGSNLVCKQVDDFKEIRLDNIEEGKDALFNALDEVGFDTSDLKFGLFNIYNQY